MSLFSCKYFCIQDFAANPEKIMVCLFEITLLKRGMKTFCGSVEVHVTATLQL